MNLFLYVGLFLAGLAFALTARAFVMRRARADAALDQIGAYGFNAGVEASGEARGLQSVVDAVAGALGGVLSGERGRATEADVRNQLMAAGLYRMTPRKFKGYRVLCAICVPVVWILIAATGSFPPFISIAGVIFGGMIGWVGPKLVVRRRAERRFAQIDTELPELIDVLVVTVEAGLGFNSSVQLASERLVGPLGDELRLTLQEQNMGLSTQEALRHLLGRCDTPLMRSFVRSILQGETLGVSIGQIMRALAVDTRKRRRQSAEERAQRAPIKILFPLIFLIFPAMFLILLGPAIYALQDALQ
jgi:tight adherence protein C